MFYFLFAGFIGMAAAAYTSHDPTYTPVGQAEAAALIFSSTRPTSSSASPDTDWGRWDDPIQLVKE